MSQMTYREQLLHPNWQKKRLEILERDEFQCQACFDKDSTLHVHHKHYMKGRMVWEYTGDELVTLCDSCHKAQHADDESRKMLWAYLRTDGPHSAPEATALIAGWANGVGGHDLSSYAGNSPYLFLVGQIAAALDWPIKTETLEALRNGLLSVDVDRRSELVLEFVSMLEAARQ